MRIDALLQGQNAGLSGLSDILSRFNVGDVIKAKIIEMTSSELLLRLFDGTTFMASSSVEIAAVPGDTVAFEVKNKTDSQLVLETLKNRNTDAYNEVNNLNKQLSVLNIKPDSDNIQIAKELKNRNLPFETAIFQKIADTIMTFKDLTPANAVFLYSNNIKPEINNIQALNQLVEGKFKIADSIGELFRLLTRTENESLLFNIVETLGLSDLKPQSSNTVILPDFQQLSSIDSSRKINISGIEHYTSGDENFQSIKGETQYHDKTIDSKFFNNNLNQKSEMLIAGENKYTVTNEKNIKSSSKMLKLLEQDFEKLFLKVNDDTFNEGTDIKELHKGIQQKLEMIREIIITSVTGEKPELLNHIQNLENNLRFINEIYQNNTYMQIPVNLPNRNSTVELYVLQRDSRHKRIDPEKVTMFISLNTGNMGQVDTLISINKKNINLNIRAEEQSVINFFKENYTSLYDSLQGKGYRLSDLKYSIIDERANIVNINRIASKEIGTGRMSIDYRI